MTTAELPHESASGRILVLAGQAFALGLTTAWITIPASAIFLANYGSELLPVTYIGAAVAGVLSSTALSAAFRRWPLVVVATRVLGGLAVALLASWILLRSSDASWVSFALLVLVPIVVPVGFVFVVGQAGMLLDVRTLKARYARVVGGFALGFVAGGLAGPRLLARFGGPEDLLAVAAVSAVVFLALVLTTRRKYRAELSAVEHAAVEAERPTLRALARDRYVMLIVAFQMLSAVESQWLDFLVLERAAQRYDDSSDLARFVSHFTVVAYGVDIVFLLVLAGLLLRRFGLRYGLTANAFGVLTMLGAIIVAGSFLGSGATIVFVLIVAARVTDLTFSDGATRTSLGAAYQAVPTRLRALSQATVEGLAVPVAIGVSGVGLLVVELAGGADGLMLPILTGLVVLTWVAVAVRLYGAYRVNLLENLRGGTLDPTLLTVESESALLAIDRLVESDDERDVRLGLDLLAIAEHPDLPVRLERLVVDERVNVRTDALERLVQLAPHMAAAAARDGLDDPSSDVRAASVRVLGATRSPADLARITAHSRDAAPAVRVAVAFALNRMGDDTVRGEVATEISRLARSATVVDRTLAARMLGETEPGSQADRTTLRLLLADPDPDVVNAALDALRWPEDLDLLPAVAPLVDHRRTTAAVVDALVRAGDAALAHVDEGLRGDFTRRTQQLLVRVAREIGGPSAVAVLARHIEHPDREVGLAVMEAIAALTPSQRETDTRARAVDDAAAPNVVRDDLEHATHVLRALVAFEAEPSAIVLRAALRDELDLLRQRALAALSMRYGSEGMHRVVFQLAQRHARMHALALEWLDVSLTGTDRAVIAMLEPGWSDRKQLNALVGTFPISPRSEREILLDLVRDRDGRWRRPWIKACALYTASGISDVDLDEVITIAEAATAFDPDDEASIVHETLAGIRDRRRELGTACTSPPS